MGKTSDSTNTTDSTELEANYIKPGKGYGSTAPQAMGSEGSEGSHHGGYSSESSKFGGKKPSIKPTVKP